MKLNSSDKKLGLIAVGLAVCVAYNIWGGVFADVMRELLRHIF